MNNLNAALKDLGFSKVKLPYAAPLKPLDEMARLAEIERRLDIEPDQEPDQEPEDQEPEEDQEDNDE